MAVLVEQTDSRRPVELQRAEDLLDSLRPALAMVDVADCPPAELRRLTARVRAAQRSLDALLVRIGVVADRQVADGDPDARDAHGTMLGDGRCVRAGSARREAARAKLAAKLPVVGAAAAEGRLGAEQLDSLVRVVAGLSDEQRQELDAPGLVEAAARLPADVFNRRLRDEADRLRGDHGLAATEARQAASSWRHWYDEATGMGRISAEFDPERYEIIVDRIEQQLRRLANAGGAAKDAGLAATAAFELLCGEAHAGRGLPHLNVVVDWDTFASGAHNKSVCETGDGRSLAPASIERLACDAVVQRVVLDRRGVAINVGRRHRTATDAQWQATRAMYRNCAWHGCDRPISWCQLHHVQEWEHGGATDMCNLIPLCHRHHHHVHEGGWTVRLDEQRRLEILTPSGARYAVTHPNRIGGRSRQTRLIERSEPVAA